MVEEQFVSFETAKILKEAGFDVPCFNQYTERGTIWHCDCPENFNKSQCVTSCPTQALAARWLRDVHRIAMGVIFVPSSVNGDVWQCFVGKMDDMVWIGDHEMSDCKYATYEEAFEYGLKRGLELIKK